MGFELITVNEYCGNNYCGSQQAKLYEDGRLEYLPPPIVTEEEPSSG
ncbi:hypothetical protein [Peribacillus saganii]|nr:hypothetical protein [Peribacillus saganii]